MSQQPISAPIIKQQLLQQQQQKQPQQPQLHHPQQQQQQLQQQQQQLQQQQHQLRLLQQQQQLKQQQIQQQSQQNLPQLQTNKTTGQKRSRPDEAPKSSVTVPQLQVQGQVQILANEIRAADSFYSPLEVRRRTAYIKKQLDNMTEDQLTRFEFFIRSHFSRNRVKEIITQALIARKGPSYAATAAGTVTEEIAIVSASLAKLFVGDLIETAIEVTNEQGSIGILPSHIGEAYRRMQQAGKIGASADNAFLFSRSSRVTSSRRCSQEMFDIHAANNCY